MLAPIGPYTLALGMEWTMPVSKAEVRAQLKEAKGASVAVLQGEAAQWVGVYRSEKRTKALAGAACLGLVAPNAIICQTVDQSGEHAWLCVIQEGKPVPNGFDQILEVNVAHQKAMEYMGMFPSTVLYGDVAGSQGSVHDLVAQLEQGVKNKSVSKRDLKACEIHRQGVSAGTILQIVVIASLPALGFFGWKEYQKYRIAEQARAIKARSANQQAMTAAQLEAEKARLVAEFRQTVKSKLAEMEEASLTGQPLPFWQAATSVRRALPHSTAGGYVPVSLTCASDVCKVTWEGRGRFTYASDKPQISGQDASDLSTSLSTTVPLGLGAAATQSSAIPPEALHLHLSEVFKRTPGAAVSPPEPVVVTPPANLGLQPETVGYQGSLRLAMTGPTALVSAASAVEVMNRLPIRIVNVGFTGLGQGAAVQIEARYQYPLRK